MVVVLEWFYCWAAVRFGDHGTFGVAARVFGILLVVVLVRLLLVW